MNESQFTVYYNAKMLRLTKQIITLKINIRTITVNPNMIKFNDLNEICHKIEITFLLLWIVVSSIILIVVFDVWAVAVTKD